MARRTIVTQGEIAAFKNAINLIAANLNGTSIIPFPKRTASTWSRATRTATATT